MTIKVTYQKTFQKETQPSPKILRKERNRSFLFFKTTFRGILAGVGH